MSKISFSQQSEQYKRILSKEIKKFEQFFKETFDLDIYLIYGTLLGAIREKDFIAHDYDVDLAYLSKYNTKDDVLKEFIYICKVLKDNNILLKVKGTSQLHCKALSDKMTFDVWTSFSVSKSKFYLAPIKTLLKSKYILPLKTLTFRTLCFNIPNMPEELMDLLYTDWKTPISKNFRKFDY